MGLLKFFFTFIVAIFCNLHTYLFVDDTLLIKKHFWFIQSRNDIKLYKFRQHQKYVVTMIFSQRNYRHPRHTRQRQRHQAHHRVDRTSI